MMDKREIKMRARVLVLVVLLLGPAWLAAQNVGGPPEWWDKIKVEIVPTEEDGKVSLHPTRKATMTKALDFIREWHVAGPFDHPKGKGFDALQNPSCLSIERFLIADQSLLPCFWGRPFSSASDLAFHTPKRAVPLFEDTAPQNSTQKRTLRLHESRR